MTLFARWLLFAAVLAGVCGAASVVAISAWSSALLGAPSHQRAAGSGDRFADDDGDGIGAELTPATEESALDHVSDGTAAPVVEPARPSWRVPRAGGPELDVGRRPALALLALLASAAAVAAAALAAGGRLRPTALGWVPARSRGAGGVGRRAPPVVLRLN